MENTSWKEELVSERFREELDAIKECWHCNSSRLLGAVTSPSPDGKNRLIFCLNHKEGGVVLSRFEYNPQ